MRGAIENVVALSRPALPATPGHTSAMARRLKPAASMRWLSVAVCAGWPAKARVAEPSHVPVKLAA